MVKHTRRRFLLAGATTLTVAIAGCVGDDNDTNGDGWEDVREIVLDGYFDRWEGVEPSFIEGESNPTLVLTEGETYTIEWINADGITHNLQIEDGDGNVLYETDDVSTEGEGDSVEFTATADMTTYICNWHRQQQVGDIDVQ